MSSSKNVPELGVTFKYNIICDPGPQSLKSHGYIWSNSQKYIVWVQIINVSFMPKIIRILSKDHVPWRYFVIYSPKAFYALFDTFPHLCFLSIGSWRKRRSEPSYGWTWRICRSDSCRVWPRPAETRETCRRERTQPRASQRPVLPAPPRNRTHTHTHTHTTVKHNNNLT